MLWKIWYRQVRKHRRQRVTHRLPDIWLQLVPPILWHCGPSVWSTRRQKHQLWRFHTSLCNAEDPHWQIQGQGLAATRGHQYQLRRFPGNGFGQHDSERQVILRTFWAKKEIDQIDQILPQTDKKKHGPVLILISNLWPLVNQVDHPHGSLGFNGRMF